MILITFLDSSEETFREIIYYLDKVQGEVVNAISIFNNFLTLILSLSNIILSLIFFSFAYRLEIGGRTFQIKQEGLIIKHKRIGFITKFGCYFLSLLSVLSLLNLLQFMLLKLFSFIPISPMMSLLESILSSLSKISTSYEDFKALFNLLSNPENLIFENIGNLSPICRFALVGFSCAAFLSFIIVLIFFYYIAFKKFIPKKKNKKLASYGILFLILLLLFGFPLMLRMSLIYSNASSFQSLPFINSSPYYGPGFQ